MSKPRKDAARRVGDSRVVDAELLAIKAGITGDQAQALIDRIGDGDMEALEAAARELKNSGTI